MKPAAWRAIALTLITVAAVFVVVSPAIEVPRATFGYAIALRRGKDTVVAVTPRSAAARAGIHVGDTLALLHDNFLNYARETAPPNGTRLRFIVNGSRIVTMIAAGGTPALLLPFDLIRLAFLAVAALLALRRSADRCVRSLVIFLGCFGAGMALNNNAFTQPLLSIILLAFTATALLIAGTGAAADFAATFPDGRAYGVNATLRTIAVAWAMLALPLFAFVDLFPGGRAWIPFAMLFIPGSFVFGIAATIAILIVGYRSASGVDRQKRLWLLGIIAAGLVGPAISVGVSAIVGHIVPLLDELASFTLTVIPLGLAYVILRHRVIDLGFVINRAVVYTLVSAFVVGVFVVVETFLGKYVEETNHVTSVAVQLGVALALGFSIRLIHDRVDRTVDRVLFRRRHEAEAALREFTHDAPYITDAETLLRRSVTSVVELAEAGSAGIWLRQGTQYLAREATFERPATIDENDPAFLSMRARSAVVDLSTARSALPGALAFPMTVRGELLGSLVCGLKRDGTGYAPDEREALAALALSVGHAYDGLEVRHLRKRLKAYEAAARSQPVRPATGGTLETF